MVDRCHVGWCLWQTCQKDVLSKWKWSSQQANAPGDKWIDYWRHASYHRAPWLWLILITRTRDKMTQMANIRENEYYIRYNHMVRMITEEPSHCFPPLSARIQVGIQCRSCAVSRQVQFRISQHKPKTRYYSPDSEQHQPWIWQRHAG